MDKKERWEALRVKQINVVIHDRLLGEVLLLPRLIPTAGLTSSSKTKPDL